MGCVRLCLAPLRVDAYLVRAPAWVGLSAREDADLLIVDCPLADLRVIPMSGWGEEIDQIVPGREPTRCAAAPAAVTPPTTRTRWIRRSSITASTSGRPSQAIPVGRSSRPQSAGAAHSCDVSPSYFDDSLRCWRTTNGLPAPATTQRPALPPCACSRDLLGRLASCPFLRMSCSRRNTLAARDCPSAVCPPVLAASGVRGVADFEDAGDRCSGEGGAGVAVGPDAGPE